MCDLLKVGCSFGYGIRVTFILLFQTIFFIVSVVNLTYLGQGKLNRESASFRLACGHVGEAFLSLLNKYINVQPTASSAIFKHVSPEFMKKIKVGSPRCCAGLWLLPASQAPCVHPVMTGAVCAPCTNFQSRTLIGT